MMNLDEMDIGELKTKATELGVSAKGNKQQLRSAIKKHLEASLPSPPPPSGDESKAPAADAEVAALIPAPAPEAVQAAAPTLKRYRITPKNGVTVQFGGVYAVPGEGMTVEEGHPLINNFDYYIETKELTE